MLDAFDLPVRRVLSAATAAGWPGCGAGCARHRRTAYRCGCRLLTPEVVAELHRGTEVVMAWPVDTPEALAQARRLGVDAVISKDLDLLRGVLADR